MTALLLVVALAGCVASKPAPQPHATILLSVVMEGGVARDRQPAGIIVGVDEQQGSGGQQFAFAPNTRIPGHFTTFLARLELPPGKHWLTRLAGVAANGIPAASMPWPAAAQALSCVKSSAVCWKNPST